tara:strand:+ start:14342 stop:14800 length:459 start_codon:yes stop_codon:yes gene_type:complete
MNRIKHLDHLGNEVLNYQGEEWRAVPEFIMYEASTAGRIRKIMLHNTKLVKQTINPQGFPIVRMTQRGSQKTKAVKHIIAMTWPSNTSLGDNVKNKDGDKLNCKASNLERYSYFEERTIKSASKAEITKYVKTATKEQLADLCSFIFKSQQR